MINTVHVLLSAYNGEKYIKEQIYSLLSQKDVTIKLTIRDDGSTDSTSNIISEICDYRIDLIQGRNIGFSDSFWTLVNYTDDESDYYAFCDQDDYWMDDKLISAIRIIEKEEPQIPVLYTSNAYLADENLNSSNEMAFPCNMVISNAECLRISKLPGCTYVFNRALKIELKKYVGKMIAHDWTTYIVANYVGKVIYDPIPHMYYRIHESNTIGIENKITTLVKRFRRLIRPPFQNSRSIVARNVLDTYGKKMSKDNYDLIKLFSNYKGSINKKLKLLKYKEYRHPAFMVMLFLGRI